MSAIALQSLQQQEGLARRVNEVQRACKQTLLEQQDTHDEQVCVRVCVRARVCVCARARVVCVRVCVSAWCVRDKLNEQMRDFNDQLEKQRRSWEARHKFLQDEMEVRMCVCMCGCV